MFYFIIIILIINTLQYKVKKIAINDDYIIINDNLEFTLDLCVSYSFFDYLDIKIDKVTSNENKTIKIYSEKYNCKLIKQDIFENSSKLKIRNFTFYYYEERSSYYPRIALAFKIDKWSSIVHMAYMQGLIDRPSFLWREDALYLGGLPEGVGKYNKGYCKVDNNYDTWGCHLQFVKFFDFVYKTNDYAYFDFNKAQIIVPEEFERYFEDKMKNINILSKIQEGYYALIFGFDNYQYTIQNKIKKFDNNDIKLLVYSYREFILTLPFFQSFFISFDYKNEAIYLYGKEGIEDLFLPLGISWKYAIIYINIVILFFGFINVLITKTKYTNKFS